MTPTHNVMRAGDVSSKRVCDDAAALSRPSEEPAAGSVSVEPRISYVIARLERAVRAQINERLRPQGLTTLQYTTLSVLGSRGQPLSNAQLARRAYMTPQAMIEVLNALERKGLIRRDAHPNHRRVYPASLTDEGRHVLTVCDASVEEMEEEMLAGLDPTQRDLLTEWLKECVRALHAGLPPERNASRARST
ncbi:MAG TPA: MarR family transcriptional regulator [Gaiellaceae bacterium]|nr:MarR family transcriptional regulator [Gaiellaceae bacterium]